MLQPLTPARPPARKAPHPADVETGARIRRRRVLAGVSQERLAERCGITFQQVQKYEKGTNRVSASRLLQIAGHLGCSAADLLPQPEGAPDPLGPMTTLRADDLALAAAFAPLSPRQKRALGSLARALAEEA